MRNNSAHTHVAPSKGGRFQQWFETFREWLLGPEKDEHPHPQQYFLPGKIILYVDHAASLERTSLSKLLGRTLRGLADGKIKDPNPQSVITFPFGSGPNLLFSLVPVEVASTSDKDLIALLVSLDRKIKTAHITVSADASIRAVSPNWLIGSASHGAHPPSPGSWPLEAPTEVNKNFLLKNKQGITEFVSGQQAGVHVAILDTAPSAIDLEEAREKWHHKHNLIDSLLGHGDDGKLHVYRDIYTNIELMDYSPMGHRYLKPDHGLFVAGIINSMAPEATLHLIKVFTSYGTGTTETIAQGLRQVLEDPEIGRPLIVNCSFGLCIPIPGHDDPDFPVELRGMNTSLLELFASLTSQENVVVVASAGNDAHDDEMTAQHIRPASRNPAAYAKVIGVGAWSTITDQHYSPASYSNRGDYMSFGGEPGEGKGVWGIYISEFPVYVEGWLSFLWRLFTGKGLDGWKGPGHLPPNPRAHTLAHLRYKRNNTGRAWWAGTSFAAPTITGLLAAQWSGPCRGQLLSYELAEAELENYVQQMKTSDEENVIHIDQA